MATSVDSNAGAPDAVPASRTAKATVHDGLRELIVELDLVPGTRLIETDLVRHFGVSKTPIREAFLRLEAEGLVDIAPYQGATVSWMTAAEQREIIFLEDTLEFAALPGAVERATPAMVRAMSGLVRDLRRSRRERDSRRFGELSLAIHGMLFDDPHSRRLPRLVASLLGGPGRRYERVFQHQFDDAWDVQLDTLAGRVEHVRRKDADGAIRHVRACHERTLELADEHADHPLVRPYLRPSAIRPLSAALDRAKARPDRQ